MAGNVFEWTRSLGNNYPYDSTDGREDLDASDQALRVVRGGAFFFQADRARCAYRDWLNPSPHDVNPGFRVVAAPISTSAL
jgi:formylglycine-generating enzyme required for sulfatase activity